MRAAGITFAFSVGMLLASAGIAEPLKRNAITPEKAGRFFASICFDIYPNDLAKAQIKAQRLGFKYDESDGLFKHTRKDQQMRINSKRCAFRFLTRKTTQPEFIPRFGTAATEARKTQEPTGLDVSIGTEDAGNGMTRVAAKLDL